MINAVSGGGQKFCTIECARASYYEPERMLEPHEVRGVCFGCGYDLSFSRCTLDKDILAEEEGPWTLPSGGLKSSPNGGA